MGAAMLMHAKLNTTGLEGVVLRQLSVPTMPIATALYDLWLDLKGEDEMPARKRFKPGAMKDYLPHLYIVDILEGGRDYRLRLIGTALTDLVGRDMTGSLISEVPETAWRRRVYDSVVEARAPLVYQSRLGNDGGRTVTTENVVLPALDRDGAFSELMCASEMMGRL